MMQMMICEIDGVAPGIWMQPIGYIVFCGSNQIHREAKETKST